MKIGEFKLIARKTKNTITIAYKKKNGLLFTVTDTNSNHVVGAGFSFMLGLDYAYATLHKNAKGFYLKIRLEGSEKYADLKLVSRDAYKKFIETDYNGYRLKD